MGHQTTYLMSNFASSVGDVLIMSANNTDTLIRKQFYHPPV